MDENNGHNKMPKNVWINTDPGIDDAFAIMMLMFTPEIKIIGISTTFGNANIDYTTTNALSLCWLLHREDIPIVKGASKPLFGEPEIAPQYHGFTLANLQLPIGKNQVFSQNPYLQIKSLIESADGKVTYIDIGPNTNSALLFTLYPELLDYKIEEFVVMGGARGLGNANNDQSEFNIRNDPLASKIFYSISKVPFTVIVADQCQNIKTNVDTFTTLLKMAGKKTTDYVPSTLLKILNFLQSAEYQGDSQNPFIAKNQIQTGAGNYDEMTAAYLINPETFNSCQVDIDIDVSFGICHGRSVYKANPQGNVKFLFNPNVPLLNQIYVDVLTRVPSK